MQLQVLFWGSFFKEWKQPGGGGGEAPDWSSVDPLLFGGNPSTGWFVLLSPFHPVEMLFSPFFLTMSLSLFDLFVCFIFDIVCLF